MKTSDSFTLQTFSSNSCKVILPARTHRCSRATTWQSQTCTCVREELIKLTVCHRSAYAASLISATDPLCGGWRTEYPDEVMGVQTQLLLGHKNLHLEVC